MVNTQAPDETREALINFRRTITREMNLNINNENILRDYRASMPNAADKV